MRSQKGVTSVIKVLVVIVLVLLAAAFLFYLFSTGTQQAEGDTAQAYDETTSQIDRVVSGLRSSFESALGDADGDGVGGIGGTGGSDDIDEPDDDIPEEDIEACEEDIADAEQFSREQQYCLDPGGTVELECPYNSDYTYETADGCEIGHLGNNDWTSPALDQILLIGHGAEEGKYNIYFGADDPSYVDTSEFESRLTRYLEGLLDHTPFGECPTDVTYTITDEGHDLGDDGFGNAGAPLPDDDADAHVVIAEETDCGGGDGPGPYAVPNQDRVVMFNGLPEEIDSITYAHEMGHLFNLCDEYNLGIWEDWDGRYSTGCLNEWPRDDGLWWQAVLFDQSGNQMDDACQIHSADQSHEYEGDHDREGYCGRYTDGAANIMGNAWNVESMDSCPTGLHVDIDVHPDTYDAWLDQINEVVSCG